MAQYAETLPILSLHAERRRHMTELRNRLEGPLAGRYTIGREIGRGGMAIVFLAHDLRHDRDVALKVLRPELAATLGPDRFLQEIRLAAGLAHPHILPLHDSGEADGCLFYVMPYVPGESLRDRLEAQGQLPLVEALEIASEIADALDYAHRASVVHRDIKPENILLLSGHAVVSDFGIARAISAAGERRWTAAGLAVGTPDYMSPEQAAGMPQIDGRSDLYSLGCVLFEMLAGRPPQALTPPEGPNAGQALPRNRLAELALLRPSVPPGVASVVGQLLALRPEDRFATAAEALEALRAPGDVWTPRSVAAKRRRRWRAAAATAAALTLGAFVMQARPRTAPLDASLFAIVPFGHRGGAAPALVTGDRCEWLLYQEFGSWQGLDLVNDQVVRDLLLRRGQPPAALSDATALAREVRAGMMVWGEVWEEGDSVVVHATLYDLTHGDKSVREYTVRIGRDLSGLGEQFRQLADSLVLGHVRGGAAAGASGTREVRAWEAYAEGHDSLDARDFNGAVTAFRRALKADPGYPNASLWLAQVLSWSNEPTESWKPYAEAAARAPTVLGPRDAGLARALVAMARQAFPEACREYRHLIARDSTDFTGWLGLAQCLERDQLVVRDGASRSGWGYRASYNALVHAYQRALELNPSLSLAFDRDALERLLGVLFTEMNRYRGGYALTPDTEWFGAFPGIDGDTLSFIPYPRQQALSSVPPETQGLAIQRERDLALHTAQAWTTAFPRNPDALERYAEVLEILGRLERAPGEDAAIVVVQRARHEAGAGPQGFRLGVQELRLTVKLGEWDRARTLADSLLTAERDPGPDIAVDLAGVAALRGQVFRAAQLWRVAYRDSGLVAIGGIPVRAPAGVADAALDLLSYAAFGAPVDSIRALEARIDRVVNSYIEASPSRRVLVRSAALDRPAVLAFPVVGLSPVHRPRSGFYLMDLQWSLAHGDTAGVRRQWNDVQRSRRNNRPGDESIDGTFFDATLFLQLGDTAAAVTQLDGALDALPTLGLDLIAQMSQSAALVRAMALRAELAAAAGDSARARVWARSVVALWGGADEPLRPLVAQMSALLPVGKQ